MPFVMEQDEPPDPLDISVFRAETVMLGADRYTHLLQEPGRLMPWGCTVVLDHRVLLSSNARKPFVYYTYVHYNKNTLTCLGAAWRLVQSQWNVRRNAMEGQRALSGTSGNKLTVSSVTRRGQEVTRGSPCETSCPRVCPGETSWGCTTDDCARKSLSPLVLGLRRAPTS